MAKKPAEPDAPRAASPKEAIVEATMRLAAGAPWDSITLSEIAREAGISLADLRDHFPSKGAILGGFARMIDRRVLDGIGSDMADEPPRERLLDIIMRRFDALGPYKDAARSIRKAVKRSPALALALNPTALNSFRYMLAAAEIETEDGLGLVRIQGAVLVWSRAIDVWLDDDDPGLAKTMAFLDKELERGIGVMRRVEDLDRLAAPFRGFMRAFGDRMGDRRGFRERMRDTFDRRGRRRRDEDDERAEAM
jgi:AcrR family transcriptional regulator